MCGHALEIFRHYYAESSWQPLRYANDTRTYAQRKVNQKYFLKSAIAGKQTSCWLLDHQNYDQAGKQANPYP